MAQQVLGWAQGIALLILVLAGVFLVGMRMFLRGGVRQGYMLAADAERTAERTATIVGVVLGPYVIVCIVSLMHPPFGRWFVNAFITDTIIWQAQFVKWMDARVQDDLAATALGGLLKGLQVIVGFILGIVAIMSRAVLKRVLGVRYFEGLREESIRQDERVAVLAELRQKGQYVEAIPAPQRPGGRWPASDSLQARLRRDVPDKQV